MIPRQLDHVVYGVPDLLDGVREVRELIGVQPLPGGRHERQGTANYLIGLGERAYLEIIGPDPDGAQPPRWFGLEHLREPRLLTWAVRPSDLDACVATARTRGYDPGDPHVMSRRTDTGDVLGWRLTADTVPDGGGVPFLIDWGQSRHPAGHPLPQLRLVSLTVLSPNPSRTSAQLAAIGVAADVERASGPGLRCVFDGPGGLITLV